MSGRVLRTLLACAVFVVVSVAPARAQWTQILASEQGLASDRVSDIAEDDAGRIWFATSLGASRYDGRDWMTVHPPRVVAAVSAVVPDSGDAVWFGTPTGALRWSGGQWVALDGVSEPGSRQVTAIFRDHRGESWIGTTDGFFRYEPGASRWTHYDGFPDVSVTQFAEDRSNALWVATTRGVLRLDASRTGSQAYTRDPNALVSDSVATVTCTPDGAVWFGTPEGLVRYQAGAWFHVASLTSMSRDSVRALASDPQGGIWVGTQDGLVHFDGHVARRASIVNDGRSLGSVSRVFVDRSGHLWVASRLQGVWRFDGVATRSFTAWPSGPISDWRCSGRK